MESFIRSKYESRRWALDGPPPTDPSILDNSASTPASSSQPAPTPPQQRSSRPTHSPSHSLSSRAPLAVPVTTRQTHQLLSSNYTNRPTGAIPTPAAPVAPAVQQQPKAPENDLFSLDFHAPATPATAAPEPKKDVKQDILSLFSTPPATAAPATTFNQFNQAAYWGGAAPPQQPVQQQPQPPPVMTGMMGNNGPGMWGVSSGWGGGTPAMPPQPNVWGAPAAAAAASIPQQQMNTMFNTNAVWGAPTPAAAAGPALGTDLFGSFPTQAQHAQQKDDAFGDIWGGFK
jgi:stromal membrane-associated protein